ncbi:MAG: hypothetical protein JXP36_16340, partial [Bacteroidales bacterium]|nr:hypothetical protein [Bacteroidales bacterium]
MVNIKTEKSFSAKKEKAVYDDSYYEKLLSNFYSKLDSVINHKHQNAISKHKERGKLLARERIQILVDEGTPFIELSALAAIDQYDNDFPSAGIITGIGIIQKKPAVIVANDA